MLYINTIFNVHVFFSRLDSDGHDLLAKFLKVSFKITIIVYSHADNVDTAAHRKLTVRQLYMMGGPMHGWNQWHFLAYN